MATALSGDAGLRESVAALDWYHTLELAPGVVTRGWFDTRDIVADLPFPAPLAGRRCLDVGTFDGFWAFEMERRGADEVVAIDVLDPQAWDWPAAARPEVVEAIGRRKARGAGFELARQALESSVRRRELSVYDLDPADVGEFDFVYLGSLLLHLRDPVRALARLRAVCRGELLVVENIDLALTLALRERPMATLDAVGRPWWWKPNLAGLRQMVAVAGFQVEGTPRRFAMPPGPGHQTPPLRPRLLTNRAGRELALSSRWGDPHAAVLATPLPGV